MSTLSVVLAEDHRVVREGLRALLSAATDIRVVGEAADGLEALGLVERLKPDVLVTDLVMPGLGGIDVAREVRRRFSATRIVVLSMYSDEAYVTEALRNGASGYVLKSSGARDLLTAIREAATGRRYLSAPLSERAIEVYAQRAQSAAVDLYQTLTTREREVLHLAAEGHSNPDIATRLSISARTAETHRSNLMRKLGLRGQTDLVRYAIRRGLLTAEPEPRPGHPDD